jgi:hypothetical protein
MISQDLHIAIIIYVYMAHSELRITNFDYEKRAIHPQDGTTARAGKGKWQGSGCNSGSDSKMQQWQ